MNKSQNDISSQQNKSRIIEVFESNFTQEIKRMSRLLDEYNYIGMDTEFPGVVYKLDNYSNDFYYNSIKLNVDELKLIQLGVTLCNSRGQSPPDGSTWQFNLRFDIIKDKYSNESITLLSNCGIKFDQLKNKGIPHKLFAEYLMVSGLVLNPKIQWISYHGSYDFAYLLKLVCNSPLPNSEREFNENLRLYFPCLYDIRILIQGKEEFKGGLNKLAQLLDIYRTGEVHQAGSDSIVTADIFFTLISNNIIPIETLHNYKNIIYGIGEGQDNSETILYTSFNNENINSNTINEGKDKLLYHSTSPNHYNNSNTNTSTNRSHLTSEGIPLLSYNNSAYYPYMNYGNNIPSNPSANGTYIYGMNPSIIPLNTLSPQNGTMNNYHNFVV